MVFSNDAQKGLSMQMRMIIVRKVEKATGSEKHSCTEP